MSENSSSKGQSTTKGNAGGETRGQDRAEEVHTRNAARKADKTTKPVDGQPEVNEDETGVDVPQPTPTPVP